MLYEALAQATREMNRGTNPANRRAIIVITDNIAITAGEDVASLQRELAESGTVVYGLIVRSGFAKVFNVLTLGKIKGVDVYAEETGGEVLGANRSEVDSRLGEMFTRLRTRYTIGYRPPETNEEGAFRHVKVQLVPAIMKANKKLVVRCAAGLLLSQEAQNDFVYASAITSFSSFFRRLPFHFPWTVMTTGVTM